MDIRLNEINYHNATLDNNDKSYIKSIIDKLIHKYPEISKYITTVFKNNGITISKLSDNELLINITASFLHSLENDNIVNEDQLLRIIKGYFRNYLELIFENRKVFIGSHPVQYEPKLVCVLSLVNYLNKELIDICNKAVEKSQQSIFDIYYYSEFVNGFRALKSSMALFSIGDDVHAISLYRGYMEITAKVKLASSFKEDYVKYKEYNRYLQLHKHSKNALPQIMIDDLGDNCKDENYIAYGWAKNKNGKRITTFKGFLKEAFDEVDIDELIQVSSEFVHEDYVGVGYDFIKLRKTYIDAYFNMTQAMMEMLNIKELKLSRYKDLYKKV